MQEAMGFIVQRLAIGQNDPNQLCYFLSPISYACAICLPFSTLCLALMVAWQSPHLPFSYSLSLLLLLSQLATKTRVQKKPTAVPRQQLSHLVAEQN